MCNRFFWPQVQTKWYSWLWLTRMDSFIPWTTESHDYVHIMLPYWIYNALMETDFDYTCPGDIMHNIVAI